jgi:hypothetical protein
VGVAEKAGRSSYPSSLQEQQKQCFSLMQMSEVDLSWLKVEAMVEKKKGEGRRTPD